MNAPAAPIRILVVDDSRTMRAMLAAAMAGDPAVTIVGEAADPFEARQMIKALNPDVLTLDIEMPGMNGLEFLEKLMRLRPMPVVMVSSLTQESAVAAIAALELGAVDVVGKPEDARSATFGRELLAKVKAAARARMRYSALDGPAIPPVPPARGAASPPVTAKIVGSTKPAAIFHPAAVIGIAASTGGVDALLKLLPGLPAPSPPIVIVQHMPAGFTGRFAERLNANCHFRVREAEPGMVLEPGLAVLAPGGRHLRIEKRPSGRYVCRISDQDDRPFRPSADYLFHSLASAAGAQGISVILTGLGDDGTEGMKAMRAQGAATFAESEESAIIYGMPKAAMQRGAAQRSASIGTLHIHITEALKARAAA